MERLLRFFVERHMLVHVLTLTLLIGGIIGASRAPRETFPNVTIPRLTVSATLPGASARDVETKLSIPIEEAIEELSGVNKVHTVVTDNTSVTQIELLDDFDADRVIVAENELEVLLDRITDFPPEMEDEPTIFRFNPRLMPVIQVALAGPSEAVVEAAQILERKLRPSEYVSTVELVGLQDPEVRVLVDPSRARAYGLTLLDISRAIERRNVSGTGGSLESADDQRQVVLWSRYDDPLEVGDTVLRFAADGGAVRVRDVASIELRREDTGLRVHTNGEPGITIFVRKTESADIVATADSVREIVDATPLPAGVSYRYVRDDSYLTRNRIDLIINNGILGAVLVAAVLYAFLTPVAATWVLAGIPVVFLGALLGFRLLDYSINIVTLTGLVVVLGMVVDDAVVVSERIVSRRQEGEEASQAAIAGAAEMARPVFASAITTALAFAPMWALGGMAGRMVASMPSAVILALALSVLESFLILPAHMSLGKARAQTPKRAFVLKMEAAYRELLGRTLDRRVPVLIGFVAVLISVFVFVGPRVGIVLFPQEDSEAFYMRVELPLGSSLERTEAVAASIQRQTMLLLGSDLQAVVARIGHQDPQSEDRNTGAAENQAVLIALLRPDDKMRYAGEWSALLERELVIPADVDVVFEVEAVGPPSGKPVEIHVSSNDDELRRQTAREIADYLRASGDVIEIDIDERQGTPQIELNLDHDRLALRSLDARDVSLTLQAAFHGLKASELRSLDETTAFRVMLDPEARVDLDGLLDLPVRASNGNLVQLRDVVAPTETPAVNRIYHRRGRRTATVSAGFAIGASETSLSFAERIDRELLPRYAHDPGLEVYVGGEAAETRKTTGDVPMALLLTVGSITLIITLMLGSFLEAAFVVAVIPFSTAGVLLAFFLHGRPLSMFGMMGALGLAGVVVNSSIVMVDSVHRRLATLGPEERDDPQLRRETVIDAVVTRLRPIVVTTLTTLGGILPSAYGLGGYDMAVAAISLSIGWGLFFSTGVTLFLVPVLYTLANDLRGARGRRPQPVAPLLEVAGLTHSGPSSSPGGGARNID